MSLVWQGMSQILQMQTWDKNWYSIKHIILLHFYFVMCIYYFFIPFSWWLSSQTPFSQIKAEGSKQRSPCDHLNIESEVSNRPNVTVVPLIFYKQKTQLKDNLGKWVQSTVYTHDYSGKVAFSIFGTSVTGNLMVFLICTSAFISDHYKETSYHC